MNGINRIRRLRSARTAPTATRASTGIGSFNRYTMGKYQREPRTSGRGSRWYFPIVYLLKEPIPVLALVAVGAVLALRRRRIRLMPFIGTQTRQRAAGDPWNAFTDFAL